MTRTLMLAGIIPLALGACKYDKEGVFIAYLPTFDELVCDETLSENISDADPPDTDVDTDSEWEDIEEFTGSDEALFMQIFEDRSGSVIAVIQGEIYVGAADGQVITLEWTNQSDRTEGSNNASAGYSYRFNEVMQSKDTITLTRNNETKGYDGNWKTSSTMDLSWTETDEWAIEAGNVGMLADPIQDYLVGAASNTNDQVDCDNPDCKISYNQNCQGSVNFEAYETNIDPDSYDGLMNASQVPG